MCHPPDYRYCQRHALGTAECVSLLWVHAPGAVHVWLLQSTVLS